MTDDRMHERHGRPENDWRVLPSVSQLLALPDIQALGIAQPYLTAAIQERLADLRSRISAGAKLTRAEIVAEVIADLRALNRPRLQPVINATGVILHTNLGRAPVSDDAARAMAEAGSHSVALEADPATGHRGGRLDDVRRLLHALTGAEDALVVTNNAAAVTLTLAAVAAGREVIVSRGEAVEIGGGFRIPDVLRQSGARLVEVGTTNRTYVRDYAEAITETTGALLKVHWSNFRMEGFVHAAAIAELAPLAADRGIPLIEDQGSGVLLNPADFGLAAEPTIGDSLAAGASVVTASGDKLLGGPQAGIIVGGTEWLARIARHPLARAVRADKVTLAGVAATLRHYLRGEALAKIPTWRMIAASPADLRLRADVIRQRLAEAGVPAEVVPSSASVGGGSLPGQTLPSWAIALSGSLAVGKGVDDLARSLRLADVPVWGRIEQDRLLLDLRSVLPEWDATMIETVGAVYQRPPTGIAPF